MEAKWVARTVLAALGVCCAVGFGGIRQAQALVVGPSGGAEVDYVIAPGPGARLASLHVRLRSDARTVSVRLDRGSWVPCTVRARTATCPVPAGEASAEQLSRVSVAATA